MRSCGRNSQQPRDTSSLSASHRKLSGRQTVALYPMFARRAGRQRQAAEHPDSEESLSADRERGAWWLYAATIIAVRGVLCALLIVVLRPLLGRYALAKPNARSSHTTPTPQGGGIAVVAATIVTDLHCSCIFRLARPSPAGRLLALFAATDFDRAPGRCRRHPFRRGRATASVAGVGGHGGDLHPAHRTARRAVRCRGGSSARLLVIGGLVVRQPREFHGWPRLDDRGRGRPDDRRRSP